MVKQLAMPIDNLERMIQLAQDFFNTKDDPNQISVNKRTISRLRKIHHSTMSERANKNGPIAWVLVIPTTHKLMEKFIAKEISEQQLLQKTPLRAQYDALYLCSALVLPEHRGKGLAKRLLAQAVRSIQKQHLVKYLFFWAFSIEGERLATSVAKKLSLPLLQREAD